MKMYCQIILLSILLCRAVSAQQPILVTVMPEHTNIALVNPGMGWTIHFYSNNPATYGSRLDCSDTLDYFPGLSTVYLRVPWGMVEPDEGQYNWALLDTPSQRWIAKGKRVALRLTCSEQWIPFATPEWVKEAGARGTFYEFGKGPVEKSETWDPFFDDPVFLEKLDNFLAAVAARYDGNPNIDFIDIGTFGLWGEGHTHMSSRQDNIDVQKLHIDLHVKHFKRTLLCISDDFAGYNKPGRHFPIIDYALSKGVTLRDDSILVQPPPLSWYHAEMAQEFWPALPVILEHEHYGPSKERGAWDKQLLLQAVEEYHASYLSIHWWPGEFLQENRDIIDQINLRMGYRLHPVRVSWPQTVEIGKAFFVSWTWSNRGVAPCYPGGFPAMTLKDDNGGIVSVLADDALNMRNLQVGPSAEPPTIQLESKFTIGQFGPSTKPGTYEVYISIGSRDGTPQIALPLQGDDGQHRYRLGTIRLAEPGTTNN